MKRYMVTLKEPLDNTIIEQFSNENMHIFFSDKLVPKIIGVEGDSLEKIKTLSCVRQAREEYTGTLDV